MSYRRKPIVFLAVAALTVAACHRHRPQQVDSQAFSWNGPIQPGGTLRIRDLNGSITVQPSTDGNARITAETRWSNGDPKRDIAFQAVPGSQDVTICAIWGTGSCSATEYHSKSKHGIGRFFGESDASVHFTAYVPTGVKVDASTISGAITVTATAPVHVRSVSGGIKVGTSVGPVDAETMNGNVDVRMTTLGADGPVHAVSMNGTASAFLPEKLDAMVKLETMNGQVGSDFPLTVDPGAQGSSHNKLNGTIGAGGREIDVHSLNGNAWLRRLNADGTVASPASAEAAPAPATAKVPAKAAKGS